MGLHSLLARAWLVRGDVLWCSSHFLTAVSSYVWPSESTTGLSMISCVMGQMKLKGTSDCRKLDPDEDEEVRSDVAEAELELDAKEKMRDAPEAGELKVDDDDVSDEGEGCADVGSDDEERILVSVLMILTRGPMGSPISFRCDSSMSFRASQSISCSSRIRW